MRSRLLLFLVPLTLMFSCTIEKRLHRPGYHIEWKKRLQVSESEAELIPVVAGNAVSLVRPERTVAADSLSVVTDGGVRPVVAPAAVPKTDNLRRATIRTETKPLRQENREARMQHHEREIQAKSRPKAAVVILTVIWFGVTALLLIGGGVLVSGTPVLGIILLVLGATMLILPLLGVGGGRSKKKSTSGFAPFRSGNKPEPRLRYRFRMRPDKDTQRKAVIIFILIVLYILLAIIGVVFGISLLTGGSAALGIILLVLGGLMLLIPAAALILVALSGK